jgi:hypothetical protein
MEITSEWPMKIDAYNRVVYGGKGNNTHLIKSLVLPF